MRQDLLGPIGYPAHAPAHGALRIWQRIREWGIAVDRTLALWHSRAQMRRELMQIDERLARDLNGDLLDLVKEARKPFWRA